MTYGFIEYTYRVRCKECAKYHKKVGTEIEEVCPVDPSHTIKYVNILDKQPKEFRDRENKIRVQTTPRQPGSKYYFTGSADLVDPVTDVGGGTLENQFLFHHEVDVDDMEQIRYFDFNTIENKTWIHEGYLMFGNCQFDFMTMDFVPTVVNTDVGENTNFNLYGGYLLIPAAGNGTVQLLSDYTQPHGGLVQVLPNEEGVKPTAFWNADWNSDTKEFENLSAAPYGNGDYNMFSNEIVFNRFINKIPLYGTGTMPLHLNDVETFPHGIRMKVTANTWTCEYKPDHSWDCAIIIVLHREKSI